MLEMRGVRYRWLLGKLGESELCLVKYATPPAPQHPEYNLTFALKASKLPCGSCTYLVYPRSPARQPSTMSSCRHNSATKTADPLPQLQQQLRVCDSRYSILSQHEVDAIYAAEYGAQPFLNIHPFPHHTDSVSQVSLPSKTATTSFCSSLVYTKISWSYKENCLRSQQEARTL